MTIGGEILIRESFSRQNSEIERRVLSWRGLLFGGPRGQKSHLFIICKHSGSTLISTPRRSTTCHAMSGRITWSQWLTILLCFRPSICLPNSPALYAFSPPVSSTPPVIRAAFVSPLVLATSVVSSSLAVLYAGVLFSPSKDHSIANFLS